MMRAIMAISAISTGAIFAAIGQPDFPCESAVGVLGDELFKGNGEEICDEIGAAVVPEPLAEFHEPLEAGEVRDESLSRFNRFRSPRNSAAV